MRAVIWFVHLALMGWLFAGGSLAAHAVGHPFSLVILVGAIVGLVVLFVLATWLSRRPDIAFVFIDLLMFVVGLGVALNMGGWIA